MNVLDQIQNFLTKFNKKQNTEPRALVSLRRQELVDITGHWFRAELLNHFLYNTLTGHEWIDGGAGTLAKALMVNFDGRTIRKHLEPLVEAGFLIQKTPGIKSLYRGSQFKVNLDLLIEKLIQAGYAFSKMMDPEPGQEDSKEQNSVGSHSAKMHHGENKNTPNEQKEVSNQVTAHSTFLYHACNKNAPCMQQICTMQDTKMHHDQDQKEFIEINQQDQKEEDLTIVDFSVENNFDDADAKMERLDMNLALASLKSSGFEPPRSEAPPAEAVLTAQVQVTDEMKAVTEKQLRQDAALQLMMSVGVINNRSTRQLAADVPLEIIKAHVELFDYYKSKPDVRNPIGYLLECIKKRELPKQIQAQKAAEEKAAKKADLSQALASFLEKAKAGTRVMFEESKSKAHMTIIKMSGQGLSSTIDVQDDNGNKGCLSIEQALKKGVVFV